MKIKVLLIVSKHSINSRHLGGIKSWISMRQPKYKVWDFYEKRSDHSLDCKHCRKKYLEMLIKYSVI